MPNSLYQKMLNAKENAKCHDKEIEGIYKNPGSSQPIIMLLRSLFQKKFSAIMPRNRGPQAKNKMISYIYIIHPI